MNKILFIPLFLFVAVAVTLVTGNSAYAATQWDTVTISTPKNTPQLCKVNTVPNTDCTTFTQTQISNAIGTYCDSSDQSTFNYVTSGGGHYAIWKEQAYQQLVSTDTLYVTYTADEIDTEINPSNLGSFYTYALNVTQGNTYTFRMTKDSTGTYGGSCSNDSTGQITLAMQYRDRNQYYCQVPVYTVTNACNINVLISSTYTINYPSGFDGTPVPGTAYPVPHVDYKPDIDIQSGTSINLSVIDKNFNTFDPVSWTCTDETAPVWHYEIWNGHDPETDTLVNSGTLSATGILTYTLNEDTDYTLVSYYECSDNSPTFDQIQFDYFHTGTIAYSDFKPNWYISNIIDNKGKFHDSNFNTFDENPFLCSGDLAPVLHWSIYRVSSPDILLTSGVQSATAEINYDFGKAEIDRDFTITGYYDCGDTDPLQFNQTQVTPFSITRAGTMKIDLFDNCISGEFPFVNIEGCLNNLYTVINLLYFGEVKFPSFTFDPNCKNLHTFASWLHLPDGYQVCPAIPSTVRNITTPFVAFMLGLISLRFLQRRSGDFNG